MSRPRIVASVVTALAFCLMPEFAAAQERGMASWYAFTSTTASGERADPNAMAAAHPSLPFGTRVRVENLRNGRSVRVRINDRGPFVDGRVIDVTRAAASRLGFRRAGKAPVRVTPLGRGGPAREPESDTDPTSASSFFRMVDGS